MIESLRFGGAEWVCAQLVSRLDRERFDPALLTYRSCDDLAEHVTSNGVPWIRMRRRGVLDIRHVGVCLWELRPRRGSILHTHLYGANVWGEVIRRLAPGVVHVSHVHDLNIPRPSLRSLLERAVVGRSDVVVAVCEAARRELVERHGLPAGRVVVIPNGVDLERYHPASRQEREEARRDLEIPAGTPLVGIVASLNPVKDHESLLRAVKSLARTHALQLLVVGRGSKDRADALRRMANELSLGASVRFLGARADVPIILRALDVAVLSSKSEAMPMTVLEYMATGLPVVCTGVGGVPETLGEPAVGVQVPKEDPQALAEALRDLLGSPQRGHDLSVRARQRAEQVYDVRKMVKRFEDLYTATLLRSAGRN